MVTAIKGNATSTFGGDVDVTGNVVTDAPAFSAYASATTSMSSGTFTKILLATEEFDTNSNFASSRFTPTVAGYYQINGSVGCGTSTQLVCSIHKNGTEYKRGSNVTTNSNQSQVSGVVYLNGSTDYVEMYCYSGVTQNNNTNAYWGSTFNGVLVRAV